MTYQPPQPPQGYPPPGNPAQGYPPQGYPPQGYPAQGAPPGYGYPPPGSSPPGYGPPGYGPPGYGPPGYGPPGYGVPPQGYGTPNPDRGPRQYNVFQAFVLFYLPKVWRDVGQRWPGIGLRYVTLVLLLTWLAVFVKGYLAVAAFVRDEAPKITNQIPKITMANGAIKIDRPEPYRIIDPDTGRTLVLFDTSGRTTAPPPESPSFLVTRNSLVMRKSPTEVQANDLTPFQPFQLDSKRVQGWLQNFGPWYWLICAVVFVFSWLWRLILLVILATVGLAFASGARAPLSYAGLMRLSAIAMTPVLLIDTVLIFVPGANLGWAWMIGGFILDLLILFLAVRANAPRTPAGYGGAPGFPVAAPPGPAYPQQSWPPAPPT